jgi:hypothetical protein
MTNPTTEGRDTASSTPATVLSALALLVLHILGGFFVFLSVGMTSAGPHDDDFLGIVRMTALLGMATEALAAVLTAVFISYVGLRKWWYAIPAGLVLTAVARMIFV